MWSELAEWLKRPYVRVEIVNAQEVEELHKRLDLAEQEARRAALLYSRECDLNTRLIDLLKSHGIKWR